MGARVITIKIMEEAEPKAGSRASKNWRWIKLPTRITCRPPRMSETTKAPITGMKTKIVPATTPGSESGRITFKKVLTIFAPKSAAASNRLPSIFSSEV